jgi:hypothetical protein
VSYFIYGLLCSSLNPLVVTLYTIWFSVKIFYVLLTFCYFVFCMGIRNNSDHFPVHREFNGFYNKGAGYLLRSAH